MPQSGRRQHELHDAHTLPWQNERLDETRIEDFDRRLFVEPAGRLDDDRQHRRCREHRFAVDDVIGQQWVVGAEPRLEHRLPQPGRRDPPAHQPLTGRRWRGHRCRRLDPMQLAVRPMAAALERIGRERQLAARSSRARLLPSSRMRPPHRADQGFAT